jgi:glycerophosphoryl diester phosphodiesterase
VTIGFAHRGARLEHPDNSIDGFARALALGAAGLESDAWVTADGVAVLHHDGVIRRGLRRVPIASVGMADLPGEIPSLAELYRLPGATGVELSLDIKDPAAAGPVLEAAGPARSRLWMCSFDLTALASWRADATVRLVHSTGLRRIGGPDAVDDHARRLAGAGVDALNLRAREWTAGEVDACHRRGVRAFGWDAQDEATLRHLVVLGVDGLYSDHVARMVAVLAGPAGPAGGDPQPSP